ncbi:MAG: hypothetical protein KIT56_05725 [Gammaproteobacteria bacterium]|nr:hypothetical protein [Gammaproteobacteria bacterium]MCW5583368.1 hypothetical protein [Gammaproteobacteria bacterium]
MNKICMKLIAFIFIAFLITSSYASNYIEHYTFYYESGDTYDVKLTESTVTWKGLEGGDKGQTETDYIKRKNFSKDIEIVQWHEISGSFVTLVFDRTHLKIISSGRTSDGDWLMLGKATIN